LPAQKEPILGEPGIFEVAGKALVQVAPFVEYQMLNAYVGAAPVPQFQKYVPSKPICVCVSKGVGGVYVFHVVVFELVMILLVAVLCIKYKPLPYTMEKDLACWYGVLGP
jgi:hypothetical protein